MRKISLPTIKLQIIVEDEKGNRKARDVKPAEVLLDAAYDRGDKGVLTIAEQRRRLPLWEKLEVVKGDTVYLEDAEWNLLKELMGSHGFGWVSKDMIIMDDAIVNAEEVKIEDVPGVNRETRRRVGKKESHATPHAV